MLLVGEVAEDVNVSGVTFRTTDHEEIRDWVEERGGSPAKVKGTGDGDTGILRIDFGEQEESLEEISWNKFFEKFERNDLAFIYQKETENGEKSRFFKFIDREQPD